FSQGLQDVLQPLNQYALFLYCFIVIHVIYTVKDLAIYFFQTHYLFCWGVTAEGKLLAGPGSKGQRNLGEVRCDAGLNFFQKDEVVPPECLKTARIAAGLRDGEGTSARLEL
ncbi:unnamed protein product, partial [Bubo scandiacus]